MSNVTIMQCYITMILSRILSKIFKNSEKFQGFVDLYRLLSFHITHWGIGRKTLNSSTIIFGFIHRNSLKRMIFCTLKVKIAKFFLIIFIVIVLSSILRNILCCFDLTQEGYHITFIKFLVTSGNW